MISICLQALGSEALRIAKLSRQFPNTIILVGLSLALLWYALQAGKVNRPIVHGARWRFEPAIVSQTRFVTGARNIISTGYSKVHSCFPKSQTMMQHEL